MENYDERFLPLLTPMMLLSSISIAIELENYYTREFSLNTKTQTLFCLLVYGLLHVHVYPQGYYCFNENIILYSSVQWWCSKSFSLFHSQKFLNQIIKDSNQHLLSFSTIAYYCQCHCCACAIVELVIFIIHPNFFR